MLCLHRPSLSFSDLVLPVRLDLAILIPYKHRHSRLCLPASYLSTCFTARLPNYLQLALVTDRSSSSYHVTLIFSAVQP